MTSKMLMAVLYIRQQIDYYNNSIPEEMDDIFQDWKGGFITSGIYKGRKYVRYADDAVFLDKMEMAVPATVSEIQWQERMIKEGIYK